MPYDRTTLRGLIRQRMGWPSTDTFVTDSELNSYITDSARELHSLLSNLWPAGQWGTVGDSIVTIPGSSAYTLPSNFGRLVSVRMIIANSLVPLEPLDPTVDLLILDTRSWDYARAKYWIQKQSEAFQLLVFYPPPAAVYNVAIYFVQAPPAFANEGDSSWMGEDEYIILDCCLKCAVKQEQDPSSFLRQKTEYQTRLEQQATPLDLGRAPTIQDVRSAASREDLWWFRR